MSSHPDPHHPDLSRRPTIHQVAKKAGVSTATVSRVLTGRDKVSTELAEQVMQAIHELSYRPNRTARLLRARKAQKIGLVVSDIQNPFFTSVVRGVEDLLQPDGYVLLVGNTDEDPSRQTAYLEALVDEGVAGIILVPTSGDPRAYKAASASQLPLVILDRRIEAIQADSVMTDNVAAAMTATRHLIRLGHTRLGFIGGLAHVSTAIDREAGFNRALSEAGLPTSHGSIQPGNYRLLGGYQAMALLLDQPDPPSAVLVANNVMAMGALQLIYERGLSIPKQIALVGFDDIPWAVSMQTPLTVIAQRSYEIGQKAAELVLARIQEPDRPFEHILLQAELIIRASCGSLPG
jgi:LacI family transcriptional regulator